MTVTSRPMVDQRGKEYRAHFAARPELAHAGEPVDGAEFLRSVEDQLATWLRTKKEIDVDVRHDNDIAIGDRSFEVVHHEGGHGLGHIKASLLEHTPIGVWRTELLGSSEGWIDLRVRSDQGRFAAVPNLAKYLLEVLPIGDGALAMGADARIIQLDRVQEVIDAVFDQERRGLVFVCGTSEEQDLVAPFAKGVSRWTREIHGLGQAFLLSPDATAAFNTEVGVFGALPWTIRTYYPEPDREDLQDSRRHRYLTTASLARLRDRQTAELLGTIARSHAATRAETRDVTKARRIFDRLSTDRLSDFAQAGPKLEVADAESDQAVVSPEQPTMDTASEEATQADAEHARGLIQMVKDVLGINMVSRESLLSRLKRERASSPPVEAVASLTRKLDQQQEEIWRLEDETRVAVELIEDAQLDEADLRDRIDRLERQEQWLRDRLREKEDLEGAYAQAESMAGLQDSARPKTLLEVAQGLTEGVLPRVVFTGDLGVVADVQSRDTMGNAAQAAWEACCALSDYVRVMLDETFEGSVEHYLKNLPDGCRGVTTKKHATGESVQTMNQYGNDRVFPVPTTVEPDGKATMEAHFKLASIGMVSPRLYYLDRVRQDGKVYIGYIGKHLRNTQTN